jgi:hypothetical protein
VFLLAIFLTFFALVANLNVETDSFDDSKASKIIQIFKKNKQTWRN